MPLVSGVCHQSVATSPLALAMSQRTRSTDSCASGVFLRNEVCEVASVAAASSGYEVGLLDVGA